MNRNLCLFLLIVLSLLRAIGQAAPEGVPKAGSGVKPGVPAHSLSAADADRVDVAVRALMSTIATDVTKDGPVAWHRHFSDSPAFFMVNDGQMAFAHSADATKGIQDFAVTIKSIRLEWGSDLRVDPLTANFAVVAVSYFEEQTPLSGKLVQVHGYFSGVAELRDGRWQLRNAHWSSVRAQ